MAYGVYAKSTNDGVVTVGNSGDIAAHSDTMVARGVYAYGLYGQVEVDNTVSIDASGGSVAMGVHALTAGGSIVVNNGGDIHAGDSDTAIAVLLGNYAVQPYGATDWTPGTSTLNNAGTISVDGDVGQAFAVAGNAAADTINNSGTISGAISLYGGDDAVNNNARGVLALDGTTLETGDGNDAIANAVGGRISLHGGTIALGTGDNTFANAGVIKVEGDGNLIDMGGGPAAEALAPMAFAQRLGAQAASAANASAFVNTGGIDMVNGATTDALVIHGDLAGDGFLNIDADARDNTADALTVDGNLAADAVQHVNVTFPAGAGGLRPGGTSIPFAWVTGDSVAGNFVPGSVATDPGDFLAVDVAIGSDIDASNARPDVFSLEATVGGLNDTGAMAASIAQGAQSLLVSSIGTWRQRMGVVPRDGSTQGASAFVRTFRDDGSIDPDHRAVNFGDGGNFGFDQTNQGTEVGLNLEPVSGFNIGATFGKADGRQRLDSDGFATDKLQGNLWGLYATWIAPSGFYLDASYRAMHYRATLDSAAGRQATSGAAAAVNLETGYAFAFGNGLHLEPQFQYTWTTVDSVFLQGPNAHFRSQDGDWQRQDHGAVDYCIEGQTLGRHRGSDGSAPVRMTPAQARLGG